MAAIAETPTDIESCKTRRIDEQGPGKRSGAAGEREIVSRKCGCSSTRAAEPGYWWVSSIPSREQRAH